MNPAIFMVRIMQCVFILSVLLFIYVLHMIHPAPRDVSAQLQWAIVCCAIASALLGFIVQRILGRNPRQSLSTAQIPDFRAPDLRGPWFAGHLIRFATAESVALFGFVLRMMGSYSNLVTILFAGSLVLLICWQPGDAPAVAETKNSIV